MFDVQDLNKNLTTPPPISGFQRLCQFCENFGTPSKSWVGAAPPIALETVSATQVPTGCSSSDLPDWGEPSQR